MRLDSMDDAKALLSAFRSAMRGTVDADEVGVLFSGGLDSSIIAILAAEVADVTLYTVGVEGSHDLEAGRSASEALGLGWEPLLIDRSEIVAAVEGLVALTGNRNPVSLSFEMPLYFVAKGSAGRLLVSGQGADELFAGYARYASMTLEEKGRQMDADMSKLMEETLDREMAIAGHHGKELRHPFLHPDSVAAVNSIPMERRVGPESSKELLREVARLLDAGEMAERKKKAAQYGSGAMRALKAEAKSRGMSVRGMVAEMDGGGL